MSHQKPKLTSSTYKRTSVEGMPTIDQEVDRIIHTSQWTVAIGLSVLRSDAGLKQKDMAELMGVSLRTYQAYEKGDTPVPSSAIEMLASNSELDISYLFTGHLSKDSVNAREVWLSDMFDGIEYLNEKAAHLTSEQKKKIIIAYMKSNQVVLRVNYDLLNSLIELISPEDQSI